MSFFNELKRRNVLRVGAAYIVSAWLLIQVVDTIFPAFGFSEKAVRIVTLVCIIGFLPTLIFAWAFELTPDGLKQEKDIDPALSAAPRSGKVLDRVIMVVLALALGYFAFDKFVLDPARDESKIAAATQAARRAAGPTAPEDRSVAVMPFVNMSSDPEQEFFADGMTEELLNILAKVPTLKVTARTSSFFFKGRNDPISTIAETLGVKHVLEGSVRRSGNRVRITAQLIEADSQAHLWSETYDRDLEDVFAIQDEVAGAIADALINSMGDKPVIKVNHARNLAAYEAYRTGRLFWWRRTPADLQRAIEFFSQAIESDPGFAPAYAAAADSWLLLVLYGGVHYLEGVNAAKPLIEQALSIDPQSPEATAARGLSLLVTGQKPAAEAVLKEAIALDETYIPARVWLSAVLGDLGRIPEQGMVLQEAIARDPLNEVLAINYSANLGSRGENQNAIQVIEGLLRVQPDAPNLVRTLSLLYQNSGGLVDGWHHARRAFEIDPSGVYNINAWAQIWFLLGRTEDTERLLLEGIERVPGNVDLKQQYIMLLLTQGRAEEAEPRIYRLFGRDTSSLPADIQRLSHFDLGLLAAARQEWPSARDHLEQALDPDETQLYNTQQLVTLTNLVLLHRGLGNPELAEKRLQTAERVVGHARVNGIEDAQIYYTFACLFSLRGQNERALQALQQAYDKGWREHWKLLQDKRLDPIRQQPAFQSIRQQMEEDISAALQEIRAET